MFNSKRKKSRCSKCANYQWHERADRKRCIYNLQPAKHINGAEFCQSFERPQQNQPEEESFLDNPELVGVDLF